jgi:cytochrome P450
MVMAGFDPRHLRATFVLVRGCDRLEGRWRRAAAAGSAIDLQADLMRFTVDAISGLAFGADVNTLESDDDIIQRHLDKIFPAMFRRLFAPFPTWRWYRTRADRELDASVLKVNAAIDGFVAAARQRLDADPARRAAPANLLEAMIVAADDPGSGITDGEVSGNVMTMLLAGEDTTANTLAWAIWLLFTHPEALARARAEIDAVAGDPATWTHERFAEMHWLEACANETMRLKPVAPSLTLQCLRDTVVADVRVPAGTLVFLALRSDSLLEEYFARRRQFDPQRWLARQRPGARPRPPGLDAVRRRPAGLPRPAPGNAGDEDGAGDADRPLRHRRVGTPGGQRAGRADVVRDGPDRPGDGAAAAPALCRRLAQRRQRLLAVGDQVLDRFEADREAHQRAGPGRALADHREVVRHRQAHRPGPGVADLEQLQGIDEGIDLGAGEARIEDDREQAGGLGTERSQRMTRRAGRRWSTARPGRPATRRRARGRPICAA